MSQIQKQYSMNTKDANNSIKLNNIYNNIQNYNTDELSLYEQS